MRSVGDLCTLIHSESSSHWENVLRPNVCHVLKSVVSGVKYLHDMGIQHYDLKGTLCVELGHILWGYSPGSSPLCSAATTNIHMAMYM